MFVQTNITDERRQCKINLNVFVATAVSSAILHGPELSLNRSNKKIESVDPFLVDHQQRRLHRKNFMSCRFLLDDTLIDI